MVATTVLEKSKFYKGKISSSSASTNSGHSYAQASKSNDIVKIKENFPNLSSKKIKQIYKVINEQKKEKPKINIMMKGPLRK